MYVQVTALFSIGSEILHREEIDGAEYLLIRVDSTCQSRVVADQLHRWNGCQGSQDSLCRIKLDQEVDLDWVNHRADICEVREHDGRGSTLLDLQDV